MPPILALFLCLSFILFLFRYDKTKNVYSSKAIWVPFLWILIMGSRPVSEWLPGATSGYAINTYTTGSPIDRMVYSILIVFGIFILFKRNINFSALYSQNKIVFIFFFYCFLSILWADNSFISFKRFVKDIGNLIMAFIILSESKPIEAAMIIIRRATYILIPLSITTNKYFPEIARTYNSWTGTPYYRGVTEGKNDIGVLCLICGFFFIWHVLLLLKKRNYRLNFEILINIFLIALILYTVKMADSITSFVSLFLGCIIYLSIGTQFIKNNINSIGIILILSIALIGLLQYAFDFIPFVLESLGRNVTFTGRTAIWSEVLNADINPIVGTGYDSFWSGQRMETIWKNIGIIIIQAHNGYIETYLNLGFVGLFLLLGIIATSFKKAKNELVRNFDFGRFRLAFLAIALMYNLTEAAFKGLHLMWFVFLLVVVLEYKPLALQNVYLSKGKHAKTILTNN